MRFRIYSENNAYWLDTTYENEVDTLIATITRIDSPYWAEAERMMLAGEQPGWTHYYRWVHGVTCWVELEGVPQDIRAWHRGEHKFIRRHKTVVDGMRPATDWEVYLFLIEHAVLSGFSEPEEELDWIEAELRKTKIDRLLSSM